MRVEFAERKGFEPSIPFRGIHTFQACSFNHSDTSLNRVANVAFLVSFHKLKFWLLPLANHQVLSKKTFLSCVHAIIIALIGCPFLAFAQPNSNPKPLADSIWLRQFSSFLAIRSFSGQEYSAGHFLQQMGQTTGLETACLNCTDTSINIAISLYPLTDRKPNLIFLSHLDVVPALDSAEWRFHPFSGTQTDTDFVSRGALDAKGLTFMHLMALCRFKDSLTGELPFNITVLAVCGEESGGFRGAKVLVEQFMDLLIPWAVYGEGGSGVQKVVPSHPEQTVFGVSVAEKVNLWLRLDLKFNSFGHGAAPPSSYVNKDMLKALTKLGQIEGRIEFHPTTKRMFRQLGQMEGGFKGWIIKHLHWRIFRPVVRRMLRDEPVFAALLQNTAVLTNIFNPPGPPNQISTRATAFLDCRLLPETKIKKFIRVIKYGLIEPRFKVSIINQCPEADESSPKLPEYTCFASALEETFPGSRSMPILFPASSDNNYFRQFGIPTYGITPVLLSRQGLESIHGPNESLSIAGLQSGAEVFYRFLQKIKGQKPVLHFTPILNR